MARHQEFRSLTLSDIEETGTLAPDDPVLVPGAVPDQVRDRLVIMSDRIRDMATELDGADGRIASAADDVKRAKINLGVAEQNSLDPGTTVTEAQIDALREVAAKAQARLQAANAAHTKLIAERNAVREALVAARRYLAGKKVRPTSGSTLTDPAAADAASKPPRFDVALVSVDLPEGSPADIVRAQRRELARLRAERKEVDEAPLPASVVKQHLREEIEDKAEDAAPRIEIGRVRRTGDGGLETRNVAVEWPSTPIRGTLDDYGRGLRIADAVALVYRLHKDAIIADIERAVDEEYAGIELALEPYERTKRLKQIDAQILQAERIEAEAVWRGIAAGAAVSFRADIAPKAVLGVA